jgi:hypothetical protein
MYAPLDAELEKLENDIRHTGARYELAVLKLCSTPPPPAYSSQSSYFWSSPDFVDTFQA